MFRYIVEVNPVEPTATRCIQVDSESHQFLAGQTFIPTHNSVLSAEELLVRAINFNHACWLVAPDYNRTGYVLYYLLRFTQDFPGKPYSKKDNRFDFPGGGYIQLRSADDPMSLRGDTLDFVAIDEAAFMKPEAWFESIMPMLMVKHGGALFTSTFWGRNWFYDLWQYADTSGDEEWKAFKFPSSASPFNSPEELARIKARTPYPVYMQEYEAEPMLDNALVFRGVPDVAVLGRGEWIRHHQYVAGLDWGSNQDYTAITIIDTSTSPMTMVALDRFNEVGFKTQSAWLADIISYWKPSIIIAEENAAGAPNIDALKTQGVKGIIPFQMQTNSKRLLIDSWRLAIEQKEVLLLNDETLIAEHMAYEAEQLPSGNYRYGAPRGRHDDTVIASALAWHAASGEYYGHQKIRRVPARGLYSGTTSRKYPTWSNQTDIRLPR